MGGAAQGGHLSPVRALEAGWGWDLAPSWAVGHSSSPVCPEWKPQPPPQWLCAPNSCPGPPPTRSHPSEKGTWRPQAQVGSSHRLESDCLDVSPNPGSASYLLCDLGQVT